MASGIKLAIFKQFASYTFEKKDGQMGHHLALLQTHEYFTKIESPRIPDYMQYKLEICIKNAENMHEKCQYMQY